MAVETLTSGAIAPITAFALVGALGVGSQWIAWRLSMPAIVLMLGAGLLIGPATGVFDPARDIGPLVSPMVSLAVAVILFEGGLTLNLGTLRDAAKGVRRLVFVGAPLGWLLSTLALRYVAGLSWESATVFGGIMIVTGPTVIAPLLRNARLARRPAAILQWEAIVNDPIGALAAVLAFQVVVATHSGTTFAQAAPGLAVGTAFAAAVGAAAAWAVARAFRDGRVPEYMKVPVLFVVLLMVFAASEAVLHESGLLAVTVMGIGIANANLPSYEELRRFKEHATVLLVSGVFILLAASLDFGALRALDWRAALFVVVVVLVVRPATVFGALFGAGLPWREEVLIAFTGPRGVVLVAVAGLFGERLAALGIADAAVIGPLAFALVAATVVLHGFTLTPFAQFLGLSGSGQPGVILVGGSRFTLGLGEALTKAEIPVLLTDPNFGHLSAARVAGLKTFSGDILSEAADNHLELLSYDIIVAATDNDAYNTLVCTDLAPEFGRDSVYQVLRERSDSARHALANVLGGKPFGPDETHAGLERMLAEGWTFRVTRLTDEFGFAEWRAKRPGAMLVLTISPQRVIRFVRQDETPKLGAGSRLISLLPPDADPGPEPQPAS